MVQLIDVLAAGVTDSSGAVVASGTVTVYTAGTTTLQTVYQEYELENPHSNPLTLDAAGRAVAYADGRVKLVISNSSGSVVRTIDDVGIEDADVLADIQADLTEQINEAVPSIGNTTINSASYTVLSTDELILADASSNAITVTLPSAGSNTGREIWIKKTDTSTNTVTVDGSGSETIDGATTYVLSSQHQSIGIISDGVNWRILSQSYASSIAYQSVKNWIINGAQDFAQRGTSVATVSASRYITDRFKLNFTNTDQLVVTVSRATDSPTLAESGFKSTYALKVDCTTIETALATDERVMVTYNVEGYEYASLHGQMVTLSFWVKSTKTGIHCVSFRNNGSDRSYVAEYTVSVANTWEYKSVTLVINQTGGTEDYTTGVGLSISWCLMSGATYQTTAGAWQTGDYVATSNQVNSLDSTSNDWLLTQAQLTITPVAIPFRRSHDSIADEFDACQRYYAKSYDRDVLPGTVTDDGRVYTPRGGANGTEIYTVRLPVRSRNSSGTGALYSPDSGTVAKVYLGADIDGTVVDVGEASFGASYTGVDGSPAEFHWTFENDF